MNKAMPTHELSTADAAELPNTATNTASDIAAGTRPRDAAPVTHAAASTAATARASRPISRAATVDGLGLPVTLLEITPQQAGTQTLLRGLAILEAAAAGVRDLRSFGAALGTTRSTTHRLVCSLVQACYLRQVHSDYLLEPKLI